MISPIKVAIVEDQKQTREGLGALISGTPGFATVGLWVSMEEALTKIEREPPDDVTADIRLPVMSGIVGVRLLKARYPRLLFLMFSVYNDNESVFEAICAGACGYLLKDTPPSRLLQAVDEARHGGAPMSPEIARKVVTMFQSIAPPRSEDHDLSPREIQVLQLLADGHSYKTAASTLDLSLDTLRFHIRNIYEKLHVHSKSEAVLKAFRTGLVR